MPLILINDLEADVKIGVWKITETELFFRSGINLSAEEETFYETIHHELRKKQWLCYRMILKELLGTNLVHITYTENGKPVLLEYKAEISVSHSADHVSAVASTVQRVGTDIEQLRERIYRVSDRFLSPEEEDSIGNEHRLEKLYVYWGAKEALYKLYGKPEVEFRRDIYIEPFDYLCESKGKCRASMQTPEGRSEYAVHYEKLNGFMLVNAVSS